MNQTAETLLMLCRCLRSDGGAGALPGRPDQWAAVIRLANLHYLTPAVWLAVRHEGPDLDLPSDAYDYLQAAHGLNIDRNQRIKQQAVELTQALTEADIQSVILKGGAHLFDGNERAFATRMMVDLDLLVRRERLDESYLVARSLGYEKLFRTDELFHHIDPIGRKGSLATIDIHRDVGMQLRILPANEVFNQASSVPVGGSSVYVPAPTHRALHCIYHSEVQAQNNYALGRIPLRYLHDLALLRQQHGSEIDWQAVQYGLSRQGYGHVVSGFLYLAERLLGLEMPEGVHCDSSAKRHYVWCIWQVRSPKLKWCVSLIGAATHVLRRPPIEYLYGENQSTFGLQVSRLRYIWFLIGQEKFAVFSKVVRAFRRMKKGS